MGKERKDLFLLSPREIKRMRKLVRHFERALQELIELKRITTFDDLRESYPPHESDLIEEASFVERQPASRFEKRNQDF